MTTEKDSSKSEAFLVSATEGSTARTEAPISDPIAHVHKCVEPEDGGYRCASRGYCECECGAWSGTEDDDWFVAPRVVAK